MRYGRAEIKYINFNGVAEFLGFQGFRRGSKIFVAWDDILT